MKAKNTKPEVVTGLVDSNGIPWTAPMSKEHPEPAWLREHKADVAPAKVDSTIGTCDNCHGKYQGRNWIKFGDSRFDGLCLPCCEKQLAKEQGAPAQRGQHTPETLIVCQSYTDRDVFPIGHDSVNGVTHIVGEINSQGGTIGQARDLADKIVKRYNAHSELIEALKELLASEESPHTETVRYLARDQARAAIAKAEGRGQ